MLNDIHTTVAAFNTANAAIPATAADDVMDAAVDAASRALQAVIDAPARTRGEALAKLEFAAALDGWEAQRDLLIPRAQSELLSALIVEAKAA
jgi:hypothetical protein